MPYDVVIVGGGIIGLSTGMALLSAHPHLSLAVLEKEPALATHQTTHNSGVIHSGVYYRPGSLKAQVCATGAQMLIEFCQAQGIPVERCGKLIMATNSAELPVLRMLYERGRANGVSALSLLSPEAFREIEPQATGVQALHVGSAGIVDYALVAQAYGRVLACAGGVIKTSTRVRSIARRAGVWVLETTAGVLESRYLITCAGLYADRLAAMAGGPPDVCTVPFRGEYYTVVPERRWLVRHMIYPVPNLHLPFLGAHLTRTIHGALHAGPNAVLALKREGYRKTDVNWTETAQFMRFPGFWRMAGRYWSVGCAELYRSLSKGAFVRALQRLVPALRAEDLVASPSGVRAQALDLHGSLLDDFNVVTGEQALYVRNVPSPAATASIRIGQLLAEMAATTGLTSPSVCVKV